MREYDLRKILNDILEEMDENEEGREYTEEVKELYEFIYELNSKKEVNNANKEIEDVIQNYIMEWAAWGVAMLRKDIPQRLSLVYSGFCFQISNTILGIFKLTKDGLDYQAMCLVRVLLEMIISFLAILVNPDYREKYFETADISKEHKIWRSTLKIKNAAEIVWNYAETVNEEAAILCQECKTIYEEMYAELSKYEHNSYANIIVMQYSLVGDDRLGLNVNGNKVTGIERVLNQLLLIIYPMEALFSRVIFENDIIDYDLPEDEFGQKMWSIAMALHIMVSDLGQKFLETIEEN